MNDLILKSLSTLPAEYRGMLDRIASDMPAIQAASENFYKSASQFKTVTLDNTALTPIRTIKQILAECDRTVQALQEAHFKVEKNKVEIRRRERKISNGGDEFDKDLWALEAEELRCQNENIGNVMAGAVRKLAFQMGQYRLVLDTLGKDGITEGDYEKEEARYHIMTAFKQAWIAANARGGHIDEGNLIYLFDLGIPLAAARAEIMDRYNLEQEMWQKKKQVATHESTMQWLRDLADKFVTCPQVFAAARGLAVRDEAALLA